MASGEMNETSKEEGLLMWNTIEMLDDEKKTVLSEILKCVVCYEIPKNKKVLICEKGHHFCSSCHKKIKVCGVCRGDLLASRNFVVEELVAKLGPILGVSKNVLPLPQSPAKLTKGSYKCQHQCKATTPSHQMLPHIRAKHLSQLVDNRRSNPYTGQFVWSFEIPFNADSAHTLSAQVSDMGLLSVVTTFSGFNFLGYVKVLGDKSVSSLFQYHLCVRLSQKTPSQPVVQYSITEKPVASYEDDTETIIQLGNMLKIEESDLLKFLNVGDKVAVYFSVWRICEPPTQRTDDPIRKTTAFYTPYDFPSDRKLRRNRNRNLRRKKIASMYGNKPPSSKDLFEEFSSLSIAF